MRSEPRRHPPRKLAAIMLFTTMNRGRWGRGPARFCEIVFIRGSVGSETQSRNVPTSSAGLTGHLVSHEDSSCWWTAAQRRQSPTFRADTGCGITELVTQSGTVPMIRKSCTSGLLCSFLFSRLATFRNPHVIIRQPAVIMVESTEDGNRLNAT